MSSRTNMVRASWIAVLGFAAASRMSAAPLPQKIRLLEPAPQLLPSTGFVIGAGGAAVPALRLDLTKVAAMRAALDLDLVGLHVVGKISSTEAALAHDLVLRGVIAARADLKREDVTRLIERAARQRHGDDRTPAAADAEPAPAEPTVEGVAILDCILKHGPLEGRGFTFDIIGVEAMDPLSGPDQGVLAAARDELEHGSASQKAGAGDDPEPRDANVAHAKSLPDRLVKGDLPGRLVTHAFSVIEMGQVYLYLEVVVAPKSLASTVTDAANREGDGGAGHDTKAAAVAAVPLPSFVLSEINLTFAALANRSR